MNLKEKGRELFIVFLASAVLALSVSFNKNNLLIYSFISFVIIIGINILIKKFVGYKFETKVKIKFWSWYRYGFRKDAHFKKPIPMLWLPLILSLFSRGMFWWLTVLEFDVESLPERASRRHGLYRFTEVTEYHIGWIAALGIVANIVFAIIAYIIGQEYFAKLSIYYAAWSFLPLSTLDGGKILFASRGLWLVMLIIVLGFVGWGLIIV